MREQPSTIVLIVAPDPETGTAHARDCPVLRAALKAEVAA